MFKKGCLILVIWLVFSYANGVGAYGIQFIKRPLPKVSLLSSIPYQIFVDPVNGLDTNPGSLAQPVQSISPKALSLLSSIKASLPGGLLNKDVQIVLRGGTYYIPSTIVLDGSYSGNNGKKVYIMAYPGETPVLSGGQLIGTVTPANANSQWKSNAIAQVQNGTWNFKRLRVGATTAIRARYPAFDPNHPYTGGLLIANTNTIANTTPGSSNLYFYPNEFPNLSASSWANSEVFSFNGGVGSPWVGAVTYESLSSENSNSNYITSNINVYPGDIFYIENVPEALNYLSGDPQVVNNSSLLGALVPNAWYLNSSAGVLTYNVPNITTNQDVVGAKLLTILKLQGTSTNNISNIVLEGLTFEDTDTPNSYIPPNTYLNDPPVNDALELDYANNITIKNSTFENLGSAGIGIESSSYHNLIYGNTINNTGSSGISIGYYSDRTTRSYDNVITFNNISNVGRVYRNQTAGVMIQSGLGNYVSNNNIVDSSYAGIYVNLYDPYRSYQNSFEYNNIIDAVEETNDMGSLYMDEVGNVYPVDSGTEFKYNFIQYTNGLCTTGQPPTIAGGHAVGCLAQAIYLDENTSGVDVYGNVVVSSSNASIDGNSNQDLTIKNNVFYNTLVGGEFSFLNWHQTLKNIVITNNIISRPSQWEDYGIYSFDLNCLTQSVGTCVNTATSLSLETVLTNKAQADTIFSCLQNNHYFDTLGYLRVDLTSTANQQALQTLLLSSACGNSTQFPAVLSVLLNTDSPKTYFANINNNLITQIDTTNPAWLTSMGPEPWSMWTNLGYDAQSIVNQDPLFANATEGNFTLNPSSPAFTTNVGFQPIPFNLIGNTGYSTNYNPPVLATLPEQSISLGSQVSFTVNASSVDDDINSLTVLNAPQGSSFIVNSANTSGTFTWTPTMPGRYKVQFLVQDTHLLSDIMSVMVNVTGNATYYWPLNEGIYFNGFGVVSHEQNYGLLDAHLYFDWNCVNPDLFPSACQNGAAGWTTGPTGNALLYNSDYNPSGNVMIENDNYNLFPYGNGAFSMAFSFMVNSTAVADPSARAFMSNESYLVNGFRMDLFNIAQGQWDLRFYSTQSGGSLFMESYPTNSPVSSSVKVLSGQFYHLVISYTGNSATMYLNGVAVATGTGIINSTINTLSLGGGIGGYPANFNGVIDGGLQIYTYALTAQDVTQMYSQYLNKMKLKAHYLKSTLGGTVSNNQINVIIDGNGMVFASSPSNPKNIINCGINPDATICKAKVSISSVINLIAASDNDFAFNGWMVEGGSSYNTCVGTTSPCTLAVTEPLTIKAKFIPKNSLNTHQSTA